jgi:hypothetical protein
MQVAKRNRHHAIVHISNNKPMYKLFIPLTVLLLHSCNTTNDDGGVCTYVTDTVGATIIRIDSTNSQYAEIVLIATKADGSTDTIRYSNNTNETPTWEQCAQRGYKVGAQLTTYHQLRTAGQCDPEYFQVQKEVYK